VKPFEQSERPTSSFLGNARLLAFAQAIRDALIPASGPCVSMQGELVRANGRLMSELLRNGMCNYYDDGEALATNYYGALMIFLLGTLIENRNRALSDEEVAYFAEARQRLEPDRELALLIRKAEQEEVPLTEEELQKVAALEASNAAVDWEQVLSLAEGCVANWCIANPDLIDSRGRPVEERGVRNLAHVFNPPPAPPPCTLCQGRGFISQTKESGFPELCVCKGGRPRAQH
jgi:hypothetical protein